MIEAIAPAGFEKRHPFNPEEGEKMIDQTFGFENVTPEKTLRHSPEECRDVKGGSENPRPDFLRKQLQSKRNLKSGHGDENIDEGHLQEFRIRTSLKPVSKKAR